MSETTTTKRERPISPHLSVYKPQITSIMSITHRMTGIILLIGAFVFVGYLFSVAGLQSCDCIGRFFETIIGKIAISVWIAAFYYHFFNGIRHMIWDTGRGFEKQSVVNSGITTLILVIISLAITWSVAVGG